LKFALPPYVTVITCEPTTSDDVLYVTKPPLSMGVLTGPPSIVIVTTPVGVPVPGAAVVTVAVNVTDWPSREGFGADVTFVVVFALLTVCT
jgi:hypothetical protein